MRIIRHYHECPPVLKHSVVALGNFDGVHKGHQQVIKEARELARAQQKPSAVFTFEPHPTTVLRPNLPPFRIEGFTSKARHIKQLGIDALFVERFNLDFSKIKAEQFVAEILVKHLAVSHVVVGRDFIFGHNRKGNSELLHQLADHYGFGFTQVKPVEEAGYACSSSNIREALKNGDIKQVSLMLGRGYVITGKVRQGDKRGRSIGVPTANIALKPLLHPAYGVYAAYVRMDEALYQAVVNIGIRPTFSATEPLLEAHLLDFNGDIYGKRIEVALVEYIRAEKRFDGIDSLKNQIRVDIEEARHVLSRMKELS